jgi:hypothetical protein
MTKTRNRIFFRDGKPFSERRGVSQHDAHTQIDFLSRTGVPLEAAEEIRQAEPQTGELSLVA